MSIFLFFICLFLTFSQSCDDPIIIIGGGMAGLAAASEAIEAGATNIIIFDKEPKVGGNSAKATSGINGAVSEPQQSLNIEDSIAQFAYDTEVSGAMGDATGCTFGEANALAQTLAENSAAAIEFLQSKGADVTNLVQLGGHRAKRTHRPQGGRPAGWTFVKSVIDSLEGKVDYRYNHLVTQILYVDMGSKIFVTGVKFMNTASDFPETEFMQARAIILATGGYANDHTDTSLLEEFRPDLIDIPTTNGPWATGDGVKLGRAIGAKMVDMEAVQIHPSGFMDPTNRDSSTKFLAPEAIRGSGAIMINAQGKRFVNELDLRAIVVAAMRKQTGPIRLLLNEEAKNTFGPGMNFYIKKGFATEYKRYTDVAEALGVEADVLRQTLYDYVDATNAGEDEFGKTVFPSTFSIKDTFVLAEITPVIHYTMGGLSINSEAQILAENNKPITGLYGAGEVTGGVHGKNRLAGNSLLECVVYGRIAGKNAATFTCPLLAKKSTSNSAKQEL